MYKTPSVRLDGRRALVTGGSRGIGLAAAAALGELGAEVDIVARDQGNIDFAVTRLQEAGCDARGFALDVLDLDAMADMIDANGPYQVAVLNAGTARHAHTFNVTVEDYEFVADTNIKAAFFCAQAVARGLVKAQQEGSMIFMSSQLGHIGAADRVVYTATKHAVEGMAKVMAWEFGKHGIRANTIAPTLIETDLTKSTLSDPELTQAAIGNIALGRVGQVEDIMGAVQFLASDASALVTGASLKVDGGWTAR